MHELAGMTLQNQSSSPVCTTRQGTVFRHEFSFSVKIVLGIAKKRAEQFRRTEKTHPGYTSIGSVYIFRSFEVCLYSIISFSPLHLLIKKHPIHPHNFLIRLLLVFKNKIHIMKAVDCRQVNFYIGHFTLHCDLSCKCPTG